MICFRLTVKKKTVWSRQDNSLFWQERWNENGSHVRRRGAITRANCRQDSHRRHVYRSTAYKTFPAGRWGVSNFHWALIHAPTDVRMGKKKKILSPIFFFLEALQLIKRSSREKRRKKTISSPKGGVRSFGAACSFFSCWPMCSTSRCTQGFPLEWRGVALGVGPIGTHSLFVLISKKVLFFSTRPQTDIIHFCRRNPIMGMRRGESVSCLLMEKNGLAINLILMTWDAYPPSVHRKKKWIE